MYPPAPPPPLHVACERGRVEDARRLIDEGAGVDSLGARGSTPLLIACERGQPAWWSCSWTAAPTAIARKRTAPSRCTSRSLRATWTRRRCSWTASRSIEPICSDGQLCTSRARTGDAARLCLDRGADFARLTPDGESPLHVACRFGHDDTVQLLLDRGASTEKTDSQQWTALYIACSYGHVGAATLLLDRGAAVEGSPYCRSAPLLAAVWNGNVDATRLCLERGADVARSVMLGELPHRIAAIRGHRVMSGWLARIHKAGGYGRYLSEPRYKLAVLRALVARGRAQRRGGEEQLLDFLFPEQPHRRARPRQRLPNGLFPIVARYYWGRDGLSRPRKLAASTPETYSSDGEETTPRCVG